MRVPAILPGGDTALLTSAFADHGFRDGAALILGREVGTFVTAKVPRMSWRLSSSYSKYEGSVDRKADPRSPRLIKEVLVSVSQEKLSHSRFPSGPGSLFRKDTQMAVIAIDCDDTLSHTNETICRWHNETYGTDLTIADFHHFQYWRLRGWGDREEAQRKVKEFNHSAAWGTIPVIEEAIAATKTLRDMGHTLIIITARMASEAERTRDWVQRLFPDTFSEIYFTSAFESRAAAATDGQDTDAAKAAPESVTGVKLLPFKNIPKPKSEICKLIGAKMLVDDSLENAYDVHDNAGLPILLFGDWNWNKKTLHLDAAASPKSYAQRIRDGEKEDTTDVVLPKGIVRTIRWSDVVEHVKETL